MLLVIAILAGVWIVGTGLSESEGNKNHLIPCFSALHFNPYSCILDKTIIMKNKIKILVPTDFSIAAENAFRHAVLMADKLNGTLLLLNVVVPDVAIVSVPVSAEIAIHEQLKVSKKRLAELTSKVLAQVTPRIENVPIIHSATELGDPESVIERYAKEKDFNLIFIGTRDEHGAMDKILGSVALNVLKNAPCPVFVIPELAEYRTTTIVTYATNLEEVDPYEIWRVSKLLAPLNPIIRCVHFEEESKSDKKKTALDMEELEAFFLDNAPALQITFHEIATDNKVDSMLEVLVTFDTNLLVTYQPHRNFWQRLMHRSFTKQMALSSKVPMLVLKE